LAFERADTQLQGGSAMALALRKTAEPAPQHQKQQGDKKSDRTFHSVNSAYAALRTQYPGQAILILGKQLLGGSFWAMLMGKHFGYTHGAALEECSLRMRRNQIHIETIRVRRRIVIGEEIFGPDFDEYYLCIGRPHLRHV